ncbi:MAG: response regulator transcription factor [Chthoniobacteraceae bacterium]
MPDTSTPAKRKVLLVEDHPMFRERLAHLINKELGMTVCGETDNIREAMEIITATKPDVAIVDITLRGSSGLELIKDIKAQGLSLPVLVLSMHEEDLYAERALHAGAQGYISKNEASSEVIEAIQKVLAGDVYVSSRVTSRILQRIGKMGDRADKSAIELLSDRELEVFQLAGRGMNSREIAKELNLSEGTIDSYRFRIRQKLNFSSSADFYRQAAQWVAEQQQKH